MQLRWAQLEAGSLHELSPAIANSARHVWCWHGRATGALLSVCSGLHSMWLARDGGLVVDTPHGMAALDNQSLLWNGEGAVRGYARSNAEFVVIAWHAPSALAHAHADTAAGNAGVLFPCRQELTRPLLRAGMRLHQAGAELPAQHWSIPLLFQQVLEASRQQQACLAPLVRRCPGRAAQTREQVFTRLLRVRNQVEWDTQSDFDIESMARIANYSRFHFIRIFRDVFEETPNDFLLRVRLQRADQLLRTTDMSVGEISVRLGFSGGASFARAFRRQFGTTASALKRASAAAHSAAGA